ncbi:MAG: lycopene cyclase domain-containing protein [Bacteroidota bacterium]
MAYTFLCINLFLILIPVLLTLDKTHFKAAWLRYSLPPVLISGIVFSAFSVFFTLFGVWSFNPAYLLGITYRDLPLEQYLFSFTFSFAALNIYAYLNSRYPDNHWQKYSLAVSNLLLGVCVAFIYFAHTKWYTVVTFSILLIFLLFIEFFNKLRFMYRFYRAYLVCLVPFYICYGLISILPVIYYNNLETVKFSILMIPLESHFLMMCMIMLGVYLLEVYRSKLTK